MTAPRFDIDHLAPGAYAAMLALERYLHGCSIETPLLHLIKLRASQINGCAFCIDMHWKDLAALGETPARMYSLDVWDEMPDYSPRERAALAWTDAVTRLSPERVPDAVHDMARSQFSEQELVDLTFAIATINAWNRLAIASRKTPGTYQPRSHELHA